MRYKLDINGYVSSVFWGCFSGNCAEYTGIVPTGYSSLVEWADNACINAYYIDANGNLVFDAEKEAELTSEAIRQAAENAPVLRKDLYDQQETMESQYLKAEATGTILELTNAKSIAPTVTLTGVSQGILKIFAQTRNMLRSNMAAKTVSGLNFRKSGNAMFINGTSTAPIEYTIAAGSSGFPLFALLKNTDYHFLLGEMAGSSFGDATVEFRNYNGTTTEQVYSGLAGTINLPETKEVTHVVLKIPRGRTFSNVRLMPALYYKAGDGLYGESLVEVATVDLTKYSIAGASDATLTISKGLVILESNGKETIVGNGKVNLLNGYNLVYTNQGNNIEIEYYKNLLDVDSLEFLQGKNTTSDKFKILEDGSIEANNGYFGGELHSEAGLIGGWNIAEDNLWSYITPPNEEIYTEADALKMQRYIIGEVTLTTEEIAKYDINGDGRISAADVMFVQQLAKANMSKNAPGKLLLNTADWRDPIKIIDGSGNKIVSFGINGVNPGPADYVVERGIDGIWTYEKWYSGKAVCWGTYTDSSNVVFTAETALLEGSMAISTKGIVTTYPSNLFIDVPECHYSYQGAYIGSTPYASFAFSRGKGTKTHTTSLGFARLGGSVSGYQTVIVDFYAVGTWR